MKFARPVLLLCLVFHPVAWAADSMHAMVLNDGKLELQTLPMPEPQAGQVRIRVRAASVNPVDWKLAQRAAPGSHSIPGRDLAGIIDAVGPDAGSWHAGQPVIAVAAGGSYTEYALASVRAIALKRIQPAGKGARELVPLVDGIAARLGGDDSWGDNHTDESECNQKIMHCDFLLAGSS